MMWYKESGRVLQSCARLTHEEIGLLYTLINFTWSHQGISENDLPAFADEQRVPLEKVQTTWRDFLRIAAEREGKWMLPEQWEGIETYEKKKKAAQQAAQVRIDKIKDLQSRLLTQSSPQRNDHVRTGDDCVTDIDLDIEKIKIKNKRQSKSHSRAKREQCDHDLKDDCWKQFVSAYQSHYGTPYIKAKQADFIQFWELVDKCRSSDWHLTSDKWARAQQNYFATPQGSHTFADLCVNFSPFYKKALDRYGKPVEDANGSTQKQSANRPESDKERRYRELYEDLGFITPASSDSNGGDGAQYQRVAADGTLGEGVYLEILGTRVS